MLASSRSDPFMRSFISASFAWSSRRTRRRVFSVKATTVVSSAVRGERRNTEFKDEIECWIGNGRMRWNMIGQGRIQ